MLARPRPDTTVLGYWHSVLQFLSWHVVVVFMHVWQAAGALARHAIAQFTSLQAHLSVHVSAAEQDPPE